MNQKFTLITIITFLILIFSVNASVNSVVLNNGNDLDYLTTGNVVIPVTLDVTNFNTTKCKLYIDNVTSSFNDKNITITGLTDTYNISFTGYTPSTLQETILSCNQTTGFVNSSMINVIRSNYQLTYLNIPYITYNGFYNIDVEINFSALGENYCQWYVNGTLESTSNFTALQTTDTYNAIITGLVYGNNSLYSLCYGNIGGASRFFYTNIERQCLENWVQNVNQCINNVETITYTDTNNCGTTNTLPLNNGTAEYCTINNGIKFTPDQLILIILAFFIITALIGAVAVHEAFFGLCALLFGFMGLVFILYKYPTMTYIASLFMVIVFVVMWITISRNRH